MSYRNKPILKLYKYENNSFILQAQIDDYQECSFEDNLYQAGQFSITINFNIPNSQLFEKGLFIQFGNSYKFGEITKIQDSIGSDGKGSQLRVITGFDARYILKRRVIKNMNSNGLWVMTGKGELVLRNLIADQAGANAEAKRQLPIINTIPQESEAIGKEYSASEQFTNLYEVCSTIATQSEVGWRIEFDGVNLTLVCFEGTDRSQTVQFSTSFDSLSEGNFTDSSESFSNAIYVGGKGQNDDRDIYEGENAIGGNSPAGLDRFESWDNQSSMTAESEYEAEASSMLTQYGQTVTMSGNGLAKCPYEYEKEYFTGDKITVAFSGKSAVVQILSVTEYWIFGSYEINFSFGKPQPGLNTQLQLILKQIQKASNKTNSKDSVRWYDIPTDTAMPASDVTYTHIGFIGNVGSGATFTLYRDSSGTGSKTYHVYIKQLGGSGKLTLTTGVEGASTLLLNPGTYVAIIYVDENGNITSQGMTATSVIESGNNQPATSGSVADAIQDITDIASSLPTDAVLHYSFDDIPDYPDGTADIRLIDNNTYDIQSTAYLFTFNDATSSNLNGNLQINVNVTSSSQWFAYTRYFYTQNKLVKIKFTIQSIGSGVAISIRNGYDKTLQHYTKVGTYEISFISQSDHQYPNIYFYSTQGQSTVIIDEIYIGDGSYATPIIDNSNGQYNAINNGGIATKGVSGKAIRFLGNGYIDGTLPWKPWYQKTFSVSCWVENWDRESTILIINNWTSYKVTPLFITIVSLSDSSSSSAILVYVPSTEKVRQFRILKSNFDYNVLYNRFHIVVVANDENSSLYINGIKYELPFWDLFQTDNEAIERQNFQIGRYMDETAYTYSKADIDDFQIFDRALSETEVQALYLNKANTPKYYNINNYNLKWKVIDINFTASVISTTYTQILSNVPDFNEAIITFSNDTLVLKRDLDSNYSYAASYAHYTESSAYDVSYDVEINWDTHILNFRQLIKRSSASWITVRKLYYR